MYVSVTAEDEFSWNQSQKTQYNFITSVQIGLPSGLSLLQIKHLRMDARMRAHTHTHTQCADWYTHICCTHTHARTLYVSPALSPRLQLTLLVTAVVFNIILSEPYVTLLSFLYSAIATQRSDVCVCCNPEYFTHNSYRNTKIFHSAQPHAIKNTVQSDDIP